MRINYIRFYNRETGWRLEPTYFDDLTLLVGVSGVGKTRILESIMTMRGISNGRAISGFEWGIEFEANNGKVYKWEGAFENKSKDWLYRHDEDDEIPEKDKPTLEYEKVSCQGKQIIDRDRKKIVFNDREIVRLSSQESIIKLLKEEEQINPIYEAFERIRFGGHGDPNILLGFSIDVYELNTNENLKKYSTLENIQNYKGNIIEKLFLASKNTPEAFEKIKERFMEIFPYVEDLQINLRKISPDSVKTIPVIEIKEIGINDLIEMAKLSSGMRKTLLLISELYLVPDGTVILIDEIENSLGVNCINEMTEDLLSSGRKIQFIITSHHPYIINSISFKHWKLVTREAGIVKTIDADKLNLGKSKHEAFMQLINLKQFKNGIVSGDE